MTRVPIPDNVEEEAKKGKKRALESEEEPGKKKMKSSITSTPRPSRSDPTLLTESPLLKGSKATPSTASTELPKGMKKKLASEASTKRSTKEPAEVKQKSTRAAAVDFFDSDDVQGPSRLSPSKPSASKTPVPRKSIVSKPSKDSALMKSKSQDEKPSETKTILKSSKRFAEPATLGIPGKAKHVKFAVKLSDSKMKRDKALGTTDKKVRSGGGKSASAKDRVLGKKIVVK